LIDKVTGGTLHDRRGSSRPLGISIISIVLVLGGVGAPIFGIQGNTNAGSSAIAFQGILNVILGWGLWRGKGWAWTLLIITSILGFVVGITNLIVSSFEQLLPAYAYAGIIGLPLDILFVYYATRTTVMGYFGKSSVLAELF
jgi:hypothetical protein